MLQSPAKCCALLEIAGAITTTSRIVQVGWSNLTTLWQFSWKVFNAAISVDLNALFDFFSLETSACYRDVYVVDC